MAQVSDYKIVKLEKGPLQRFKNQNMLLKKFGEVGLQVYKAITGKRTTGELRTDLGMEEGMFSQIIDYMRDAGMIELETVGARTAGHKGPGEEIPQERFELGNAKVAEEEEPTQEEEEGAVLEEAPQEEEAPPMKRRGAKGKAEEEVEEQKEEEAEVLPEETGAGEEAGIRPILPEEMEEEEKTKPLKKGSKKKKVPQEEVEITPVGEEELRPISDEEAQEEEEAPSKEEGIELEPETPEEEKTEGEIAPLETETGAGELETGAGAGMSPVEKIISDKYGDVGLQVYTLIDGQRTAEEIMRETGLTESKLVEILDFMDEQGIIKLDYPKSQPPPSAGIAPPGMRETPPVGEEAKETGAGFSPMLEGEESVEGAGPVPSPLEIPLKAPLDLVKSVQMKAKIMLKYGDKGGKVLDRMDGKNDMIDIALLLDMPLYAVKEIVDFMMQNGMIIVKPMPRADVRKKYGEDGYAVYKLYGKEGLMFYELIGKELTIKQMADKVTKDKSKVIEMFIFIHKVLGIEIPIDQGALRKQLGI